LSSTHAHSLVATIRVWLNKLQFELESAMLDLREDVAVAMGSVSGESSTEPGRFSFASCFTPLCRGYLARSHE
jgi:hypothetical protein